MAVTKAHHKQHASASSSGAEECNPISVTKDATYCIKGPVCTGTVDLTTEKAPGGCPRKGDAAIKHCSWSYSSYVATEANCIAPVDAHCVITPTNHWRCVYPAKSTTPSRNESVSAEIQNEASPSSAKLPERKEQVSTPSATEMVLSKASMQESQDSGTETRQKPDASLNIVVAASCCVLALVGLTVAKKRRSARSHSMMKPRDSSVL